MFFRQASTGRWLALLGALVCALAVIGCAEEGGAGGGGGGGGGGSDEKKAAKDKGETDCGKKASDDCTPSVSSDGKVRVDALTWGITSAKKRKQLGDQEYGLGEKADGVFVVVTLKVRSDRDESATLSSEVVQLEGKGTKYDVDTEGTVAAIGAGEDPLFFEDLGPDQTTTSKVVFDVPPKVLKEKPKLRFNELGFGETHGYIELPSL